MFIFTFLEKRGHLKEAISDTKHNFLKEYVILCIYPAAENLVMKVFDGVGVIIVVSTFNPE